MNSANAAFPAPSPTSAHSTGYETGKRLLDLTVSALLLVLSSPLMGLIVLAIRLDSSGPALFKQERVGKNGTSFYLLKFRSMRIGTPNISTAEMQRQSVSPITRVGAFLRRTSLDELPQLWNILRGEMSLVGPRPALPSQTKVNELRKASGADTLLPGITGWAQINGRDELSDEEKAAHDAYYRHHRSLKLDLRILARTIIPVLTGRGNR